MTIRTRRAEPALFLPILLSPHITRALLCNCRETELQDDAARGGYRAGPDQKKKRTNGVKEEVCYREIIRLEKGGQWEREGGGSVWGAAECVPASSWSRMIGWRFWMRTGSSAPAVKWQWQCVHVRLFMWQACRCLWRCDFEDSLCSLVCRSLLWRCCDL